MTDEALLRTLFAALIEAGWKPPVTVPSESGRCDSCDPSFGCFDGSKPCSKAIPSAVRQQEPDGLPLKALDTPLSNAAALYHMCAGIDGEGPEFAYVPIRAAQEIERKLNATHSASAPSKSKE